MGMTFEEQFPNLKPVVWNLDEMCNEEVVSVKHIQDLCLDKQRVKEAINNIYTFIRIDRDLYDKVTMKEVEEGLDELKRGLGL